MVVFVQNKHVRLGVDEKRGGAISYISSADKEDNVINTWDTGRLLQQSYYGNSDGSSWNGRPWKWNPVQGGSWDNAPSKLVSIQKLSDIEIITKCHPRNWGGCQLCEDVLMTTHIKLEDDGDVCVKCIMSYTGEMKQGRNVQEVPACFLDARFSELVYKNKRTGEIARVKPNAPGVKNIQKHADPKWAGYVDPKTMEGVFISSPIATSLTAYRVDIAGNPRESNCSYLAPLLDNYAIRAPSTTEYVFTVRLSNEKSL
jgi:hypothetical protein